MPTKLKFRKTPYPTVEELQPFINGHEKLSKASPDETALSQLDPLSSRVPANAEIIRLGEAYRKEFPTLVSDHLTKVREFFLREITPYLLACSNGLQDAQDILQVAFDESPQAENLFSKIENAVGLALDIRILSFVKSFTGLNEEEAKQFVLLAFSKELKTHDNTTAKLLEMLSLHDLPGTPKVPKVQLRKLQEAKGNRQPAGDGRAGDSPKGRRRKQLFEEAKEESRTSRNRNGSVGRRG